MMKHKNYYPFYFILVLLAGIFLGQYGFKKKVSTFDTNNKINNILQYIQNDYVDSIPLSKIEEITIESILAKLDPHSAYFTAEAFHAANDPLLGKFDGIGVQFRMINDSVVVILPLKEGPSAKEGIIAGDRIVIADNDTLAGKKYSSLDIQQHLKGERGTQVSLWIKRKGNNELIPFVIKRDAIPTHSIDAYFMLDSQTGLIKLSQFSASTIDEFEKAMEELSKSGMKKLILDLRGNTGGYLGAAIYIADQFLEKGALITYTEGVNRPKTIYKATGKSPYLKDDLILLIDQNSASASEIVAGAIQDNDRGLIVGRRSFGKGLVQEQMENKDGSAVRLTVARYYTPSGRSIQRPYENGNQEYYTDYYNRIHNEMVNGMDSSSVSDSQKYKTLNGRVVFGGGGIWPDHYIAMDTTINFSFYNQLLNKSLIYQFAFNYVEKNRAKLTSFQSVNDFLNKFRKDELLYNQFINLSEVQKLKPGKKDLNDTKPYILTLLKAEIARNLFEDGFYPVFLQNDNFVDAALKLFNENESKTE